MMASLIGLPLLKPEWEKAHSVNGKMRLNYDLLKLRIDRLKTGYYACFVGHMFLSIFLIIRLINLNYTPIIIIPFAFLGLYTFAVFKFKKKWKEAVKEKNKLELQMKLLGI